ncbi:MAG: hypothetical protein AMS21_07920 [Gemmatimonas sp. SG8_38_2]|nr:MAG: hypothetical protein AMS21_07920 [Gemmatimonas sp. SG8_38_2]
MKRISPVLLLAFVALACNEGGPTDTILEPQFAKPDCTVDPPHPSCKPDGGTVVKSATGDYLIVLPERDRWIRFSVAEYGDGSVAGDYRLEQFWSDGKVSKSGGDITCFAISVDGSKAWFGGKKKGKRGLSNQIVWRVIDGDPELSTLACPRLPDYPELDPSHECYGLGGYTAEDYCAARPDAMPKTLYEVSQGFIELKQ